MNILFLDSIDKNIFGGMEEWIRLVGAGLNLKGHNIYIASRRDSTFLKRVSVGNPELNQIPLSISGDFNPATIAKLYSEIKTKQIDIILVNFNKDLRLGLIWMALAVGLALCGLAVATFSIEALYGCLAGAAFPFAIGLAYMIMWRYGSKDVAS